MVGGRCTDKTHRCKAKQGRRGKTALIFWILILQEYGFWTASRGEADLFGNHDSALFRYRPGWIADYKPDFRWRITYTRAKALNLYTERPRGFKKPASPD
jgi:hypothetical protein